MTRYLVAPNDARKGWVVKYASGRTVSTHNYKRTALNAARRTASSGDTLTIYGQNGRVLKNQTVR